MQELASPAQREAIAWIRSTLAIYAEAEDLIQIGAYAKGSSKETDAAIAAIDAIKDFLTQDITESASFEESLQQLLSLMKRFKT